MMQRLAFGGIPSFFAAPLSPSSRLKRLQSVLSARYSGFRPTGALSARAANRLAGAIFDCDEKRLHAGALIAAAAKATRVEATPLADPRLIEALGALTSSLHREASLSPSGVSRRAGT